TVWDVETGRKLAQDVHLDHVWGVAFSPDGKTLASATLAGAINLWDMMPAEEATTIANTQSTWNEHWRLTTLRFTPDGRTRLAAGKGPTKLCDVAAGKVMAAPPNRGIVAASADANVLAGLTADGNVTVWDLRAGRETARWSERP